MVELDAMKQELQTYEEPLKEVQASLDLDNKKNRIQELEREMEAPDFWNDAQESTKKTKELKSMKDDVKTSADLQQMYDDVAAFIEMGNEAESDDEASEIYEEALDTFNEFKETLEGIRMKTLLSGEYDANNATVSLRAEAGGTEACDWTSMLFRMYTRWAEKKGFSVEVLDQLDGDEAGIKSVTFQVNGDNAYGYLKSEVGTHRLVRISPFNANGKRQTSFAGCEVIPEFDEAPEIEIPPEDIRIDTYRSSGAGGQHINKTSSAIRITHFPTGIVVTCQNERSQLMNKDKAMQILKERLYFMQQMEREEAAKEFQTDASANSWGSQIRSYVMQPYKMVKDLRTGEETGNVDAVMDGDIDQFINAYLKWQSLGCPKRGVSDAE